ncbi:hypothetical protein PHYSODRAFT_326412 [Phytophthora sojae]|uniref:Uncharacterized protein n=1 Tax=Phytophthora sojae (strain P6497) TaxID=1094619 RepID=G4YSX2_PHYSP|nr:hypothetical protein PHYSODRAFT_326412 [Phytophthora sojae]EGZ25391.1 hypothetical protein PHYSODRAFT_326412 [Phytophthora sojae]|eukprot:XP_009520679.1 hypothetical protein PHYSODRAFT_326412 [Phytophthora sojae]
MAVQHAVPKCSREIYPRVIRVIEEVAMERSGRELLKREVTLEDIEETQMKCTFGSKTRGISATKVALDPAIPAGWELQTARIHNSPDDYELRGAWPRGKRIAEGARCHWRSKEEEALFVKLLWDGWQAQGGALEREEEDRSRCAVDVDAVVPHHSDTEAAIGGGYSFSVIARKDAQSAVPAGGAPAGELDVTARA